MTRDEVIKIIAEAHREKRPNLAGAVQNTVRQGERMMEDEYTRGLKARIKADMDKIFGVEDEHKTFRRRVYEALGRFETVGELWYGDAGYCLYCYFEDCVADDWRDASCKIGSLVKIYGELVDEFDRHEEGE